MDVDVPRLTRPTGATPAAARGSPGWLHRLLAWDRVVACLALGSVAAVSLRPGVAYDTWWHLAAGRWMVDNRAIVRSDPFSFTRAGEAWTDPGWLADLLLYGLHRVGGTAALTLLVAGAFMATFALVWRRLAGPPWLRLATVGVAVLVTVHAAVPRPLLLSVLLVAVVDAVLEAGAERPRVLWAVPFLVALWANLHAAFLLGPALVGLHALGEAITARRRAGRVSSASRRLALVALSSVAAVSLNPYGPRLLAYPFETLGLGVLRLAVHEWQRPDLLAPSGIVVVLALAVAAAALVRSRHRASATEWLVLVTFGALGLTAIRHSFLVGTLLAPITARHLATVVGATRGSGTPPRRPELVVHAVLLGAVTVAVVGLGARALAAGPDHPSSEAPVPTAAVGHLAALEPGARLFNDYEWGGYVIWALHPAYPTFVDGRTDLFGDELVRTYVDVALAAPGWREVLAEWDIDVALLRPALPLVDALRADGWRTEFDDGTAVILVRDR